MRVYLDNSATTKVDPGVLKKMLPYFSENYGNPSSIHFLGEETSKAIEQARNEVAKVLNCLSEEIIFTSGATESNNLALMGVKKTFENKEKHLIVSNIEHHCILNVVKYFKEQGFLVSYLPVNNEGIIEIKNLEKMITDQTALISIMYVNNEIGTIQPIEKIGKLIKKINQNRKENKILFHVDAVQAVGYLSCDVKKMGVDFLSLSAHKFYGPKGVGILYCKKGIKLKPIMFGGKQEKELRPGTYNVSGIVGLAEAIKIAENGREKNVRKIIELRDQLKQGILKKISRIEINGSIKERIAHNLNISFKGVEGEALVLRLSLSGIAISTGSACSQKTLEPSHVLMALGKGEENAHSSVRFSFGKFNTKKEVHYVLKNLFKSVQDLRKISGFKYDRL